MVFLSFPGAVSFLPFPEAASKFIRPWTSDFPTMSRDWQEDSPPVCIFEIGQNHFQIDLGRTKGKVCLVPHGWGQEIDRIQNIRVQDDRLILKAGDKEYHTAINSQNHIPF